MALSESDKRKLASTDATGVLVSMLEDVEATANNAGGGPVELSSMEELGASTAYFGEFTVNIDNAAGETKSFDVITNNTDYDLIVASDPVVDAANEPNWADASGQAMELAIAGAGFTNPTMGGEVFSSAWRTGRAVLSKGSTMTVTIANGSADKAFSGSVAIYLMLAKVS